MFKKIATSRLLLAVTSIVFLAGCGSNLRHRDDSALAIHSSTTFGADCNQFSSTGLPLAGRATAHYLNGIHQEDRTRLRITSIAGEFSTTTNMSIRFFRWTVDADGNAQIDQQPLNFTLEYASPYGSFPISGAINALTVDEINKMIVANFLSINTAQDFFNNVTIIIAGTDYAWSALKVALYSDSNPVSQADMLLPIYAANPNAYAATHHPMLSALHPFSAQRAEVGVSDADWVARSKSYCF